MCSDCVFWPKYITNGNDGSKRRHEKNVNQNKVCIFTMKCLLIFRSFFWFQAVTVSMKQKSKCLSNRRLFTVLLKHCYLFFFLILLLQQFTEDLKHYLEGQSVGVSACCKIVPLFYISGGVKNSAQPQLLSSDRFYQEALHVIISARITYSPLPVLEPSVSQTRSETVRY